MAVECQRPIFALNLQCSLRLAADVREIGGGLPGSLGHGQKLVAHCHIISSRKLSDTW